MPSGDRTGPNGAGPMTGRGAGFCSGAARPGYANPLARGYFGRGRGRGRRNWFYATGVPGWMREPAQPRGFGGVAPVEDMPPQDERQELEALRNQAHAMRESLSQINERLEELQAKHNQ